MKRSLSRSQAAELLRAASVLPPASRDAFLRAVDNRLVGIRRRLNDGDVAAAIVTVLADASITTTHCFVCDAAPTEEADMARPYLKFDIRTGRPIEDDDDVLRDGQRISVPLMLRDGMSDMQRAVAADKAARRGFDDSDCRHQLGPVHADRSAAEEAYTDAVREACEAWRTPSALTEAADRRRRRKVQARDPFGRESGTLEEEEWELEEEEDGITFDAAEGRRRKREAYERMCREDSEAWRNPAPLPVAADPPRQDAAPTVPRTMDAAEARRIKRQAYDRMCAEDREAWRNP